MTSMNNSDSDLISKVFQDSLSITIAAVTSITDRGITNRVYVTETAGGQKYIARLNEATSLNEFKKELWASEKARGEGVTTPQILRVGVDGGTAYSIQEHIEGIHGTDYESASKIWQDMGVAARLIHSVPTSGFGDRIDEQGNFLGSWNDYLSYNIESLTETDFLLQDGILTKEQSIKIKTLLEKLRDTHLNFGLVHGDLSLKNTLVDNQEKTWIIDWGSAHSHIIPHYDLIEILQSSIDASSKEFQSFLVGYGYTIEDFNKISEEIYSVMILRAVDKVRWAKDRKPELLEGKVNTLKKVLTITQDLLQ